MLGLMMAPRANQARLPSRMATLPCKVKIETEHFHSHPIISIIIKKLSINIRSNATRLAATKLSKPLVVDDLVDGLQDVLLVQVPLLELDPESLLNHPDRVVHLRNRQV